MARAEELITGLPCCLCSSTRSPPYCWRRNLIVVSLSVYYRYVLASPIEWADDVARDLMVGVQLLRRGERDGPA